MLLQTLNTRRRERKKIADCVVSRLCLENGKEIVNKKRIKKNQLSFCKNLFLLDQEYKQIMRSV